MNTEKSFMPAAELGREMNYRPGSIYNQHSSGVGPLAGILVKVGGKLGCWREDFELWKAAQRRMRPTIGEENAAA